MCCWRGMGTSRWIAVENPRPGRAGTCRGLAGGPLDPALERGEGGEELAIARVGEDPRPWSIDTHWTASTSLCGPATPPRRIHHPVADELVPSLVVGVRGAGQLEAERAPEPRLFLHLADRAFLVRLAALELALGEGPVPPMRTVDEQHLEPAVSPLPRDHAPCRVHDGCRSHGFSMPTRRRILQVQNAAGGSAQSRLSSNRHRVFMKAQHSGAA